MAVFTLTLTDKVSPSPNTDAGRMLVANMDKLRHLGYTDQSAPQQNVSALNIPQNLLNDTTVFLVGSPANHDPCNQRLPGELPVSQVLRHRPTQTIQLSQQQQLHGPAASGQRHAKL